MARQAPVQNHLQEFLLQLGNYLQSRGDFPTNDIIRTQDICQDFCMFLQKDPRVATPEDYAAYLKIHSGSIEEQREYARLLDGIYSFCNYLSQCEMTQDAPVPKPKSQSEQHFRNSAKTLNFISGSLQGNDSQVNLGTVSEGLNQFDFSMDNNLADQLPSVAVRNRPSIIAPAVKPPTVPPNSVANQIQAPPPPPAEPQPVVNNALLRSVNNVNYDFSSDSIKKMREVDVLAARSDDSQTAPPAAASTKAGENAPPPFHSWIFDGKYEIDRPLPIPQKAKPYTVTKFDRVGMPLIPSICSALIGIALCAFGDTMNGIPLKIGLLLLLVAILCFFLASPELKTPNQNTILSTLSAYLDARAGRCYSVAARLLAVEGIEKEIDLGSLWKKEGFKFPGSLAKRFSSQKTPEYTIVNGSEQQNAVLLLIHEARFYYLIPMARVDNRWYILDPALGKHIING